MSRISSETQRHNGRRPCTSWRKTPARYAAFDAADAALAASGTVTSELALARTPMVVAYRLGWLTYALARPFVHVPYIVLVNLVLQRQAIPEFVQQALHAHSACQTRSSRCSRTQQRARNS